MRWILTLGSLTAVGSLGLVVAPVPSTDPALGVTAGTPAPGPATGVVYAERKGRGEVRMVRIGEERGRPLLLLDVEVECDVFTPEARVVTSVDPDGRFEVATRGTDNDTSDSVTAVFDDIDGRVRTDAAALEIDVEVSGEDNAGPTGDCEETQEWRIDARRTPGARRIDGTVDVTADVVTTGADAVFSLRRDAGAANAVIRVAPSSLDIDWEVDAPRGASLLGAAAGAVWVLDVERVEVVRYDATNGERIAAIPLDAPAVADQAASSSLSMVATDAAVWVGVDDPPWLYRIDPATNAVTARLDVLGGVRALAPAPDGNGVVASSIDDDSATRGGRLVRFDAAGVPTASVATATVVSDLAADTAAVWAQDGFGAVTRHDPTTLAPLPGSFVPRAGTAVGGLTAAAPGAWVTTERGLMAFDTTLRQVGSVPVVGAGTDAPAAGFDALWVLDSGYLVRVEVASRSESPAVRRP
jgi:hypothetical protein